MPRPGVEGPDRALAVGTRTREVHAMQTLAELIAASASMPDIAAHLDRLESATRLEQALALGERDQARLFDLAKDARHLGLGELVPPGTPPLVEVVHEGRNSLPLFRRFAKVMCRPDGDDSPEQLWGYNRNPALVATTVGPGYFVVVAHGDGESLVDYLRVPPRKPEAWPAILPNDARLSRFVYNGTQDVLRGVSTHVSIGRATRAGKVMNNWFVLCRSV